MWPFKKKVVRYDVIKHGDYWIIFALDKNDNEIGRYRGRGGTVWFHYHSGARCSTSLEFQLSAVMEAEYFRRHSQELTGGKK